MTRDESIELFADMISAAPEELAGIRVGLMEWRLVVDGQRRGTVQSEQDIIDQAIAHQHLYSSEERADVLMRVAEVRLRQGR